MATTTVFFDDPFWVAVLELRHDGHVHAVRQVFGAEPTDAELYQYLLREGTALFTRAEQAASVPDGQVVARPVRNPKRLAREAARAAGLARPTTAAQEAMRRDLEVRGQAAAKAVQEQRERDAEKRRQARRAKSRARRRGQ
ncbi:MAG TPA: YjdF family protein [Rugosimonospora sp.]|jgi:hypothetical protein